MLPEVMRILLTTNNQTIFVILARMVRICTLVRKSDLSESTEIEWGYFLVGEEIEEGGSLTFVKKFWFQAVF